MKLCDTSVLVDIDRGGVGDRVDRLDDEGRHAVSTATVTELRLGVNKRYDDESARADALEELERLLARLDVVATGRPVTVAAADVIAELQRRGDRFTTSTTSTSEQRRSSSNSPSSRRTSTTSIESMACPSSTGRSTDCHGRIAVGDYRHWAGVRSGKLSNNLTVPERL